LTFFTHKLRPSVGPLEAPVGWWFKISVRPLEGGAERTDLFDRVALAPDDGLVQEYTGNLRILGQVDVANRLLGQPGTEEFVVGVTVAQPQQHAVMTILIEAFVTRELELADLTERVGLAAARADRLVLDAPADIVDAAVGDAHDMKRVVDADRMIEVPGRSRAIALGQVGGDDTDGPYPGRVLVGTPSAQVRGGVALHHVDDPLAVQIDQPGHDSPVLGRGREERGLVDAKGPDFLHSLGVLNQWRAMQDHGVHHGPPAHPELAGDDSDRESELSDLAGGLCSCTHCQDAPAATCSMLSVQVLAAQSRSTQRQRRFSQTSRAGRPKHGRSLMSTLTRPLGLGAHTTGRVLAVEETSSEVIVTVETTAPQFNAKSQ
jgi:hypothetical protein